MPNDTRSRVRLTRGSIPLAVTALAAAALAATGDAVTVSPAFACPDPKTAPLGKSVGIRGFTACNDGASAQAVVDGQTYRFTGGVCFKDAVPLNVTIGTIIINDRKKSDPAGFSIVVQPKGNPVSDSVDFALNKGGRLLEMGGPVTLTYKPGRRSATFKGKVLRTVNGKVLTGTVPVSGSFICKRILTVPS